MFVVHPVLALLRVYHGLKEEGRGEEQREERKQVRLKLVKQSPELTLERHPL